VFSLHRALRFSFRPPGLITPTRILPTSTQLSAGQCLKTSRRWQPTSAHTMVAFSQKTASSESVAFLQKPRLTFPSSFDTITVDVGTEGLKIPVLEALIRKSSTFFDNALKSEWATSRADPRVIDLTDEDPIIFKMYLNWLYFKTIPLSSPRTLRRATPNMGRSASATSWAES
jgi:hypothetical protein